MYLLLKLRLNYILIPLLVIITGSAASYFAQTGKGWYNTQTGKGWYNTLNLPNWTPANSTMAFVWAGIFLLGSISVLIIWNKYSRQRNFGVIMGLFILNAMINVGWNILFFGHQQLGLAFFQAILLLSNLMLLIVLIWKFCPPAASLLFPYSIWVLFSTILTLNVWLIN
jgi:tryptophan-rich sensory protein